MITLAVFPIRKRRVRTAIGPGTFVGRLQKKNRRARWLVQLDTEKRREPVRLLAFFGEDVEVVG